LATLWLFSNTRLESGMSQRSCKAKTPKLLHKADLGLQECTVERLGRASGSQTISERTVRITRISRRHPQQVSPLSERVPRASMSELSPARSTGQTTVAKPGITCLSLSICHRRTVGAFLLDQTRVTSGRFCAIR